MSKKANFRRICAWCDKILFEANGPTTHGICVDCSKEILRKIEMKLTKEQEEFITEAIGKASMCWNPRPGSQVFDSEQAIEIARTLINKLNETMECSVCKSIENRDW